MAEWPSRHVPPDPVPEPLTYPIYLDLPQVQSMLKDSILSAMYPDSFEKVKAQLKEAERALIFPEMSREEAVKLLTASGLSPTNEAVKAIQAASIYHRGKA